MKFYVMNVFADDQAKALKFYTNKLGFIKKKMFLLENIAGLQFAIRVMTLN